MNYEQQPRPEGTPLTLEQVASLASEILLRDGYHIPTVIADGDRGAVAFQITRLGDTFQERQRQMFQAGFALARDKALDVLRQVFHICEAWLSVGQPGQKPHYPPSQDPNRKEVLMVARLHIGTAQTEVSVWEMLRDAAGKLTDVVEFQVQSSTGEVEAASPLLDAFAAGFALGATPPANPN